MKFYSFIPCPSSPLIPNNVPYFIYPIVFFVLWIVLLKPTQLLKNKDLA
jgi:hypothetical protein